MAMPVSVRDVVEAIELQTDESAAYLDKDTGEVVLVTDEDRRLVEEGRSEDDLPAWQREALPKVREALESGRFLRLPNKFDVHEWDIMRRFSGAQEDERVRRELLDAIHGSGAFRMFRRTIGRLGLEDSWYQFRDKALEEIAREWLEDNNLPYH